MGKRRADEPQDRQEQEVPAGKRRPQDEDERQKEQGGRSILEKGDVERRMPRGQPPVKDGQDGKGEARQNAPANPLKNGIPRIEAGDDKNDSGQAAQGKQERTRLPSLPVDERLEERGEEREARVGQEPDRDRRDLDRPKERDPVKGQE